MSVTWPDLLAFAPAESGELAARTNAWATLVEWTLLGLVGFVIATAVIKGRQLRRWRAAQQVFERELSLVDDAAGLFAVCQARADAPAARLCQALLATSVRSTAVLDRAVVGERRRLNQLMVGLATTAAVAPFIGLLGTVYGILDAFLRIGEHGAATLAIVAPAVGQALAATALGLVAAIPAVAVYNVLGRALDDLLQESRAIAHLAADRWLGGATPRSEPRP
jgi:biopolymer transport protein TolQ